MKCEFIKVLTTIFTREFNLLFLKICNMSINKTPDDKEQINYFLSYIDKLINSKDSKYKNKYIDIKNTMTNDKNKLILNIIVENKLKLMKLKINKEIIYESFINDIFYELFSYAMNNPLIYINYEKKIFNSEINKNYTYFYKYVFNTIDNYIITFIYDNLDIEKFKEDLENSQIIELPKEVEVVEEPDNLTKETLYIESYNMD